MPAYGHVTLAEEFQVDVKFYQDLLPSYNGISILQKSEFDIHDTVELDACLTGCGGMSGCMWLLQLSCGLKVGLVIE